ncbi:unnamed protein product [Victoria cruziana]
MLRRSFPFPHRRERGFVFCIWGTSFLFIVGDRANPKEAGFCHSLLHPEPLSRSNAGAYSAEAPFFC